MHLCIIEIILPTLLQKFYDAALYHCKEESMQDETYYNAISVSMNYNMARLLESQFEFDKAEKFYKDILREHPSYVDCKFACCCCCCCLFSKCSLVILSGSFDALSDLFYRVFFTQFKMLFYIHINHTCIMSKNDHI